MELIFEGLYAALEATRGTAANPPTYWLPMKGFILPKQNRYRPDETRGLRAKNYRSVTTRRWAELGGGKGPLDPSIAHVVGVMALNGSITTPTTPGGAAAARLWTIPRAMTSDNLKSATIYGMDPNVQQFRSAYMMIDEWSISSDGSSEDGIESTIKASGAFPSATAASSIPAQAPGPILPPGLMEIWLDTSSAIGTTSINTFVRAELTIPTGIKRKWIAGGPTNTLSFQRIGMEATAPTVKLAFEVDNLSQVYNLWENNQGNTVIKTRIRFNGPEIEPNFRYFVEYDTWLTCDEPNWAELEGTNRLLELTLQGEYDTTNATDLIMRVQNTKATL